MKKILAAALAGAMTLSFASVGTMAFSRIDMYAPSDAMVLNGDGDTYGGVTSRDGSITIDGVTPGSTIYIPVYDGSSAYDVDSGYYAKDFRDSRLYSVKTTKSENTKLVKSIDYVTEKNVGDYKTHGDWIKIIMNDSTMTSERKFEGSVTFKAKKSYNTANRPNYAAPGVEQNDTVTLDINLWVNNKVIEGSDGNAETGEGFYFSPEKNETNTLIWGDNRASLRFDADNDASKFYARLSTKTDASIYAEYGDPVNADLWFYDFVGNPTVPATSRATLTLGYAWDIDDEYAPNPNDCFIYQKDADGFLTDVTDQFVYSEDAEDIEGWSIKTRVLGTYIISDTELDLDAVSDDDDDVIDSEPITTPTPNKPIPQTGSGDMVNVAVAAAIASIAAAGIAAFRKASK